MVIIFIITNLIQGGLEAPIRTHIPRPRAKLVNSQSICLIAAKSNQGSTKVGRSSCKNKLICVKSVYFCLK